MIRNRIDSSPNGSCKSYNKSWLPSSVQPIIFKRGFNKLFPYGARLMHAHIIGKSGSGKSELLKLFLWNDIQFANAVLVFDAHGMLAEDTLSFKYFKDKYRNDLVYISPEFGDSGYLPTYNPLEHDFWDLPEFRRHTAISIRAKQLVGAFEVIFENEFSSNMSNMATQCLILLMQYKGSTMLDFLNLLNPSKFREYQNKIDNHWDDQLKLYFNTTFKNGLKSTKEAISNRFQDAFGNQYLRHILCAERSSFKLTKLLDQGKKVILNVSQSYLSESGVKILGSLLMADLTAHVLSRGQQNSGGRRIMVHIDECQNFLSSRTNKVLEEARKYGLHLTLANQHYGQISNYKLRSSINSNTAIKVCGMSSNADKSTMSAHIGIDVKSVPKLRQGKWVIGVNEYPTILKAYDFLVFNSKEREKLERNNDRGSLNSNYMSRSELEALKLEQRDKYYINVAGERTHVEPKTTKNNPFSKVNKPKYERFKL